MIYVKKCFDEIKRKAYFSLQLECTGTTWKLLSQDASTIEYVKEIFFVAGTNCSYVVEETMPDYFVYSAIFSPDAYNKILMSIEASMPSVGSIESYSKTYYNMRKIDDLEAFVFERENEYAAPYCIIKDKSVFYIICREGLSDIKELARFIREITYRLSLNAGFVCFHAAAVNLKGKGVLIVGSPGAGKSTIALALCRKYGAHFLSNDRVLLKQSAAEILALPFALPVKVNKGTLLALDMLSQCNRKNIRDSLPDDASDWADINGKRKVQILCNELETAFDIRPEGKITIDVVVYPRSKHKYDINIKTLRENCFSIHDPDFPNDWLSLSERTQNELANSGKEMVYRLSLVKSLNVEYTYNNLDNVCESILEIVNSNQE